MIAFLVYFISQFIDINLVLAKRVLLGLLIIGLLYKTEFLLYKILGISDLDQLVLTYVILVSNNVITFIYTIVLFNWFSRNTFIIAATGL